MAKEMVVVGCRIPQGMILHHPKDRNIFVKVSGPTVLLTDAGARIRSGVNFGTTPVDAELWAAWSAAYKDNPILTSKAIFAAKNETEAVAQGKELQKEKTGFEQMPQNAMGIVKDKDGD